MQEIVVRAMPVHGHEFRRRAGRAWGKQAVTVKVVENPKPHQYREDGTIAAYSDEISPADYKELTEDQHLAVFAKGDPNAGDMLGAQAEIGERDKEIRKLRKDLADAQEASDLERKATSKEIEDLGFKLAEAQAEAEKLRAQLGKKKKD
jgi:hypothetical protein